jgi:dienelactone hydrolase
VAVVFRSNASPRDAARENDVSVLVKTVLGLMLIASVGAASAQSTPGPARDLAARTEIHSIASLTLSDEQFLAGDSSGRPVTVAGVLRIAQGSGRLPLVVMMHGSGGISSNVDGWSRELLSSGISTFAIDGFTGRSLVQTNTNQASLGRLNFIVDIYRSLEILANHPRVDPSRIVLMGFSRGGQAVLYASLKRFHRLWNRSGVDFASYLPFYPDCTTKFAGDTDLVDRPIHIFQGTPDDYNPIAACKSYIKRLLAAGRSVELTEYPNAPHAFDIPLLPRQAVILKDAQTVRRCRIEEDPQGHLQNLDTSRPFSYADACVERDPHVGYDAEATAAAYAEVKAIIDKLNR